MAIPLVGVGLLYKNGYFRQDIDSEGRQVAQYPINNFALLPISMVYDADKQPVYVQPQVTYAPQYNYAQPRYYAWQPRHSVQQPQWHSRHRHYDDNVIYSRY